MSTIISNDNTNVTSRVIDYTQNGILWVPMQDQLVDDILFFYSLDGGMNWNQSTASTISTTGLNGPYGGWFIDKDNGGHLVYANGTDNQLHYRYGTYDAENRSWTWSSPIELRSDTGGGLLNHEYEVVAHREGSGWVAHVSYPEVIAAVSHQRIAIIDINSSHSVSLRTRLDLHTYGTGNGIGASLDFHHEATDPKAVQGGAPHLYIAYAQNNGTSTALFYRRIAYSAGTWTPGTEQTLDANAQYISRNALNLFYDGTRIVISHVRSATPTVVRVDERDEADTTTTSRDPTAITDGNLATVQCGYGPNGDIWLFAQGVTSNDFKKIRYNRTGAAWDAAWVVVEAEALNLTPSAGMMRAINPQVSVLGVVYLAQTPAPNQLHYATLTAAWEATATLQGVATVTASPSLGVAARATLQGAATLGASPSVGIAAQATLQGVATLRAAGAFKPKLDFTVYDLYIDDGQNVYACILHEDDQTKGATRANPIRAEKQDVGQNPLEQRPEFGDYFAQGDFSHGSDQDYFHHVGRDERKYLMAEGFDISEPGLLQHLRDVLETLDSSTVGRITQAGGVLFVTDGTAVKRHNGLFPGAWASEDPRAGETAQTVEDITSRGAELFAALGSNGVHVRASSGAWTHFQPDGATNLSVGTATRVEWLKDRLMVIGDGGRSVYEVVADSTPDAIKTLPEGWTFTSLFEAGAFIYAPAVNPQAGLSRVHILGLNSNASAIEDKGSVPIPRGELIYAGIGDPGGIFLGGGRRTDQQGYDPVFYQAIQSETGFLQLIKIAQGEGAETLDCSVRAFESLGDAIVFSWSVGSGAPTGARTGLGWYHLGRQAFAFHLRKVTPTASLVTDIIFHEGRLLFVAGGDGVYCENVTKYVSEAYLISSMADFGSAGLKSWDQAEVSHKALPSGASVVLQYTTKHVDEGDFTTALTSSTVGALGAQGRLSDIKSSLLAVKLVSHAVAGGASAPEIQTFSMRSNPTRPSPEFVLSRFVRVLSRDRKDPRGEEVYLNPVTRRIDLMQLLDSWVTVYEPGITWVAFIKDVADAEPAEPFYSATGGEPLKDAFLVRLDMVATGEAS